jgi:hypothetical protein
MVEHEPVADRVYLCVFFCWKNVFIALILLSKEKSVRFHSLLLQIIQWKCASITFGIIVAYSCIKISY